VEFKGWIDFHLTFGFFKISLISYFLFLLLLVFICILGLAHIFFIINTMYFLHKNLKPYFVYIQQLKTEMYQVLKFVSGTSVLKTEKLKGKCILFF